MTFKKIFNLHKSPEELRNRNYRVNDIVVPENFNASSAKQISENLKEEERKQIEAERQMEIEERFQLILKIIYDNSTYGGREYCSYDEIDAKNVRRLRELGFEVVVHKIQEEYWGTVKW